ncbi:PDZ/DHR/GLGF domain protein [Magnetococcus marinus MC-1]|uniref:PDZ/DHR/GLGF domain protein n=1 Tax=Magnetococcus marinus (strain ATCC BAA-1437 / JCM 17883 / MC-1) TaxID=156889 RepID=A0LC18_MAGMM|nr:PDZ domain-containing protein [Magnetococcus marinus]ABK45511.1 PDZ/DHR/GLGF domain protein [Magnetococcus marinus MC-1]
MKKPLRYLTLLAAGLLSSTPALAAGWLGASLNTPRGVQVGEIIKGSPADHAGLEPEDIILELNGQAIHGPGQFARRIATTKPGTRITLKVMRKGKLTELKTTLEDSKDHASVTSYMGGPMGSMLETPNQMMRSMPFPPMRGNPDAYGAPGGAYGPPPGGRNQGGFGGEDFGNRPPPPGQGGFAQAGEANDLAFTPPPPPPNDQRQGGFGPPPHLRGMPMDTNKAWLGIAVQNSAAGVVLEGVAPTSPAAKAGLQAGDRIEKINDTPITGDQQLVQSLAPLQPGQKLTIHYVRDGKSNAVVVDLVSRPAHP